MSLFPSYLGGPGVPAPSSEISSAALPFGKRVQLSSLTIGSKGSVQVQGGAGNAASAVVIGSSQLLGGTYPMVTCRAADCLGLAAGHWVVVQNSVEMPKNVFNSGTGCSSIDTLGNFTLTGSQAWTYANSGGGQINGFTWQIELQQRYTCFKWNGVGAAPVLTGIQEGDWVIIGNENSADTISSRNTGTFRVVRVSDSQKSFWVENSNSSPEVVTAGLWFLTFDSIMPGDTLSIGASTWGAGNQGTWTVKALNSGDVHGFQVDVSAKATSTFSGPGTLGSSASLFKVFEASPGRLIKQILSVSSDPVNGSLVNIKFQTSPGYVNIGAVAGSLLQSLDKLAFPTTLTTGIDGYQHSVGLIGEVARVLYGDEQDPATYPGVVAAGRTVNISGPLVKRISVSLSIRIRSGVTEADVKNRVRSAVASVINQTEIGQSVPISDIVTAAGSVNGVLAVTILSPAYTSGQDLISVQPYEKPLVLNLDSDIQVSLIGQ